MSRSTVAVAAAAILLLFVPSAASGADRVQIGLFDKPVYVTSDPLDPDRLLVAESRGVIVEVRGGERSIWADLQDRVLCCEGERGILSITPAPDFHTSDRLYVAYTGESAPGGEAGDLYVDAFRHLGGTLIREPILDVPHATDPDENGGQLQFGRDGALYAAFGDGGGVGDPFDDAQDLESLLGKLIRIFPNPGGFPSYIVPGDNPFIAMAARDEIWSFGLRNPRRFSFDRATGDMVIADTGQDAREEINFAPQFTGAIGGKNVNYGWDCREGTIDYPGESSEACKEPFPLTDPVFDYPHEDPGNGSAHGCSIVGGYVARDQAVPDLYGRYLYGDLCLGAVRSIDLTAADPGSTDREEPALGVAANSLSSFGEDSCGRLYVVARNGPVYRVIGTQPSACAPAGPPAPPVSAQTRRRRPVVGLRARHAKGEAVRIKARVRPCLENRGRRLILKRNGRRAAKRRVRGRCVVRFRVKVAKRARFRALLRLGRGRGTARSRTVVVRARGS